MATVDMTQRTLNFPPRFLPYLEKHRIFELFHECIELLVQEKPRDHIQFLKKILSCAAERKDKQRIVLLAPPGFDRETFGMMVANCLGIQHINRDFMDWLTKQRKMKESIILSKSEKSIEEESCICPGEDAGFFPIYYPTERSYEEVIQEEIEEEEKEECKEEPCICVCPCVKQNEGDELEGLKRLGEDKDNKEDAEEEGENEEEALGETSPYPCPPRSRRRRKQKYKITSPAMQGALSDSEIDYSILNECEISAKGWILTDFPETGEEAEELCRIGVLPTHALRIVVNEKQEMNERDYKWTVFKWIKVYKSVPVMDIQVGERTMEELSADMCRLLSIMPHRHAPMLPRIVLIGSRGSGATTQAKKLAKKYGLVHVEFELVIARALQRDDDIVKLYKQQIPTGVEPEVEAVILERVLLSTECRNKGWVLTGYPKNIDQLRTLDIVATPPNRIIFIEIAARECFVRLYYRKIDPCLGDEYKIPEIMPSGLHDYKSENIEPEIASRLLSHPKNNKKQIIHDIETYCLNKKEMMAYCGKTASYVDGDKAVDTVFELIEKVIIDPAPAQPPRDPLAPNYGFQESYQRLKKFRLSSGLFFNNLVLNPPEASPSVN